MIKKHSESTNLQHGSSLTFKEISQCFLCIHFVFFELFKNNLRNVSAVKKVQAVVVFPVETHFYIPDIILTIIIFHVDLCGHNTRVAFISLFGKLCLKVYMKAKWKTFLIKGLCFPK